MNWNSLPSLGLGGGFSSDPAPSIDWGSIVGNVASIAKTGLDIRTAIRTPTSQPVPASTSGAGAGDGGDKVPDSGGGISTPMLLIGGGVAVLAAVLIMKG